MPFRPLGLCLVAALVAGGVAPLPPAAELATDANIVTGIDLSDSVTGRSVAAELAGIAAALRSDAFLSAVRRGGHGRVGFAVYGWFQRSFPPLVPWRVIASEGDARGAAAELEAFDFRSFDSGYWRDTRFWYGRLTDLSAALDHGRRLLDTAPYPAARGVLNVVGNGTDNVGEDVDAARDRMLDAGFTVNAVVTGGDPALVAYFTRRVAGGWGAFVLTADPGGIDFVAAMQRKLTWDIAAAR